MEEIKELISKAKSKEELLSIAVMLKKAQIELLKKNNK
ncbi:Uncharacterised protein [Clostridium baratii]|uniref:Uncharacterized protein n=1 Tax=Clostridium baratii TaxID=1561 RepID=A0A174QVZ8_9CLOT|nr:Uncharacterised protein [Clostridium baratii]